MIVTDLSINIDWVLRQGDDNAFTITFIDSNGSPFDISGYTFESILAKKSNKGNAILTLTEGSGLTNSGIGGVLTETINKTQSASLFEDYYHQIRAIFPDATEHVLYQGDAIVNSLEYKGSGVTELTTTVLLSGTNVTATISLGGATTAAGVGLGNVDNTADVDKPVSTAQQTALDLKEDIELPSVASTFSLTFDVDEDFLPITGGALTYTISGAGNINGVEKVLKINTPTSVAWPSNFFQQGVNAIRTDKLNIVVLHYYENYNGLGLDKVGYVIDYQDVLDLTAPTIGTFSVVAANADRVLFNSSEIITASTFAGFTITGKTITGLTIQAGLLTGHYFTVSAVFTEGESQTIAYNGADDFEDTSGNQVASFTATAITNTITSFSNTKSADFVPNDYVDVTNAALRFSGTQAFTITGWINMDDATAFRLFTGDTFNHTIGTDGSDNYAMILYTIGTADRIHAIGSSATADEGTWVHITYVYDGGTTVSALSIYRNAVSQSITDNSLGTYTGMTQATTVKLGTWDQNSSFANGKVDGLSFFNVALSAGEITEAYNAGVPFDMTTHSQSANLIADYRFEDNLNDSSGQGNNGSSSNPPVYSVDVP
jgi:hypothetical protein